MASNKRKRNPLPSKEYLNKMLAYDPETGDLMWKARTPDMFPATTATRTQEHSCAQWNARWANKPAMTKSNDGYVFGTLNYAYVSAHRVIWKMMTDIDPDIIDHINGVRNDNRFENLRNVNETANHRNRRLGSNSKSGTLGVHFAKRIQKWTAYITLGSFDTKEEAIAARKAAEQFLGFHENHGSTALTISQ